MDSRKAGSRDGSPVVANGRSSCSPIPHAEERSTSPSRCVSTSPMSTNHSPVCSVSSSDMNSNSSRIHSTTTPIRPIPQIPHTVSKHILDRTTSPLSINPPNRDFVLKKPLMTSPHHHLHPHPSSSHHLPKGLLLPAHHNNNNQKENNTPVLVPTRPSFMISDILGRSASEKPRSRSPLASGGLNLSQRSDIQDCSTHRKHSSNTDFSVSLGSDYYHQVEKRKAPDNDEDGDSDLDVEESDCESSSDKGKCPITMVQLFLAQK